MKFSLQLLNRTIAENPYLKQVLLDGFIMMYFQLIKFNQFSFYSNNQTGNDTGF